MAAETKVYIGDTGTVLEAETDKDLTGAVTLRLEMVKPQGSALSQPLTAADTAVTLEDTSEFADSGYAEIEDERITIHRPGRCHPYGRHKRDKRDKSRPTFARSGHPADCWLKRRQRQIILPRQIPLDLGWMRW